MDSERAYLKVLKALRDLIAADFAVGGWLPPGRAMSERLGVNPLTYRKAVACLVAEGMATAFPGKGHLIQPLARRPRKIGLVVGDARECPYFGQGEAFVPVFQRLAEDGLACQLIQSSPVGKLADKALIYCVEGLLWLSPPAAAMPTVLDIARKGETPLVVAAMRDDLPLCQGTLPGAGLVVMDMAASAKARADFLRGRGHREAVYVTGNALQRRYFNAAWEKAGGVLVDGERLYDMVRRPGELAGALRGATALLAECGGLWMENIFKTLAVLPPELQPECLVPETAIIPELRGRFPMVKLVAVDRCGGGLAAAAAGMLADHLHRGLPLGELAVSSYSRKLCDGSP